MSRFTDAAAIWAVIPHVDSALLDAEDQQRRLDARDAMVEEALRLVLDPRWDELSDAEVATWIVKRAGAGPIVKLADLIADGETRYPRICKVIAEVLGWRPRVEGNTTYVGQWVKK